METMESLEKSFGITRQALHKLQNQYESGEIQYNPKIALSSFFFVNTEIEQLRKANKVFKANKRNILSTIGDKEDANALSDAFSVIDAFISGCDEYFG